MFKKILVAFDGSDPSAKAFDLALDLALKYSAALKVLAVVRPPEFGEEVETEAVVNNSRKHLQQALKPLRGKASHAAQNVEFDVLVGHPAERIVIQAEQWGADLIVIGHRGRGLAGRWLLGSVAKQVMHHATCAVLVAR
ncbi:universal stress protein [Rhodoferax sp.]|uniref:universal stress protein n=1 Tax=Rhodoferax sp. TaxID=50421 RepID=UPI00284E14BC|nr:universal stress protein [Rhodoferax sp.]MDR3368867.1 universal stress protein [Rhodoferax sp.]